MEDFAHWMRIYRERAGLNQKELAERAGYTPGYISMLESRKKPPPSDTVVARLESVLGVADAHLIEWAHMERTPHDIRRRVVDLSRDLEEARQLSQWVEGPFRTVLAGVLLGDLFVRGVLDSREVPARLRPMITGYLARRKAGEKEKILVAWVSDQMGGGKGPGPKELLDWVGQAYEGIESARSVQKAGGRPGWGQVPLYLELPSAGERELEDVTSGAWREVPAAFARDGVYCLLWTGDGAHPRIESGDFLLVDQRIEPESGSLVLVEGEAGPGIFRYLPSSEGVELVAIDPHVPPILCSSDELRSGKRVRLEGVLLEIHRVLR